MSEVSKTVTSDEKQSSKSKENSDMMAFRMQSSAPELMDLSKETKETLELHGAAPRKPSFANNCLLARRLVERGVRRDHRLQSPHRGHQGAI